MQAVKKRAFPLHRDVPGCRQPPDTPCWAASPSPSPGGHPAAGGCRTAGEVQEPSTSPVASVPMTQRPYGTITSGCFSPTSQGRGQVLSTAGSCGSLWVCKSLNLCRNGKVCCMCYMQRTDEFWWVSEQLPVSVMLAAPVSKQLVKQWEIIDRVTFGNQKLDTKQKFLAASFRANSEHAPALSNL